MNVRFLSSILGVVGLLFATGGAAARPLANPIGTAFTYQGRLKDGAVAANGSYDLQFALFDAESAGTQVGSTVSKDDVTVTEGLFTVELDFGSVFDGTALWLEIGVRPGGETGAYTQLTPRQPLTPTPYALHSASAPWGGLTGVPAGFTDGVDNGSAYQNIRVVAKSGGDYTTITAALASITDASDTNRYLIYVAPGVYTEQVIMEPFVDIQGSGELNTKITAGNTQITLSGADNAELRFLKVENTGGSDYAFAINNNTASPRLTHVTATAVGGVIETYGVYNYGASPTMTNVTASASGGDSSFGVANDWLSSPTMSNVTASASGATSSYGVHNSSSSPTMTNVTASASGATSSYGVKNFSSSPTMANVTASASGGTTSFGVFNQTSVLTMTYVTASASGGAFNYGVYNVGSFALQNHVQVNNSQITGSTNTIFSDSSSLTQVGASQLSGGPISGSTVFCAGVYDEGYNFYPSACP